MTNNRADVLAANEAFYRAFKQRDIQAMSWVWFQGEGSICVHPGGKAIAGWENIRNSWERIFGNTNDLEIEVEVVAVEVTEAVAYVVVVENIMQIVGGRRFYAQSVATNIFRNMAQKWVLVHHHGSPRQQRKP
ncbi:MAG: nuclear transport factor 2 family protein [Cyanobacteriota bacterium]|nr:nuclear transport factor 2 family protein [Cyanobacteriota bacterium]